MKTTTPIIFSLGMLAALVLPHDVALWAGCISVPFFTLLWAIGEDYLWM
jgi:hypothetical protein